MRMSLGCLENDAVNVVIITRKSLPLVQCLSSVFRLVGLELGPDCLAAPC